MNKPTLTQSEIQAAAILLIAKNGKTTSLEVKNFLRDANFEVYQTEVSNALIAFQSANDQNIDTVDNGTYRTYVKNVPAQPASTNSAPATASPALGLAVQNQSTGRVKVFITPICSNANGLSHSQLASQYDQYDYVVFSANTRTPIAVYSKDETRDHVRTHYARINNVSMQDVRAKRVANFVK